MVYCYHKTKILLMHIDKTINIASKPTAQQKIKNPAQKQGQ